MTSYFNSTSSFRNKNKNESMKIQLGKYVLNLKENDDNEQTLNITWMKTHEYYNSTTEENDIALLKLDRPVNFTDSIQPATLPKPDDIDHSQSGKFLATAVGWGSMFSGEDLWLSIVRPTMEVEVYVWNETDCANTYAQPLLDSPLTLDTNNQICAGFDMDEKLGGDTCTVSTYCYFIFNFHKPCRQVWGRVQMSTLMNNPLQ